MGNEQKTLDKQTGKFAATCIENLPGLSGERMQDWIDSPKKLKTRLSILKLKKIVVVYNSTKFINDFYEKARMFLGENLGEIGNDYSVIHADYGDTDRIVFIDFKACVLTGSGDAAEMFGGNTTFYRETRKFEMAFSFQESQKIELFVLDPEFLSEFERKDKEQFLYWKRHIVPKETVSGTVISNQFIFKQ